MNEPLLALPALLETIDRPGDFYVAGHLDAPLPLIEVDDVGPLAFPILEHQGGLLLASAEPAPYGRGDETLVDPDVRRAGQIAPTALQIADAAWVPTLENVVEQVRTGLGVDDPVEAQLYKMLVYGPGDFFVEHRDTEKAPGMFATLVIVLPAVWSGGELVVRHGDREATVEVGGPAPGRIGYVAFYADCVHALKTVTQGHRVALVYNLCRVGQGALDPPEHASVVQAVAEQLRAWIDLGGPSKLLLPLSHHYTQAGLSFAALKGRDRGVAQVLRSAAEQLDCAAHLAMVSISEWGPAVRSFYPRRRRWEPEFDEDDDFEVVEVEDRDLGIEHWHPLGDGGPIGFGRLPFDEFELCPPDALEGDAPDEEAFHEATGNAGATFDRTYRRAVVVLWRRADFGLVWSEAQPVEALRTLGALVAAGDARARPFAHDLIPLWPGPEEWGPGSQDAALYAVIAGLGDRALARRLLAYRMVHQVLTTPMVGPMATLIGLLDDEPIWAEVAEVASLRTARDGRPWVELGVELLDRFGEPARPILAGALSHLPETRRHDGARRRLLIDAALVVAVVRALIKLDDPNLTMRALGHIEAHAEGYDVDVVLLPAALTLSAESSEGDRGHPAFAALRSQCIEHLDARIAEPLAAPDSWAQTVKLECNCADCVALGGFLRTEQRVWRYRVAKAGRRHLYREVERQRLDVDARTIRTGRPFTWEATKNRKSHEARVKQRAVDLAHREQLIGTLAPVSEPDSGPKTAQNGVIAGSGATTEL